MFPRQLGKSVLLYERENSPVCLPGKHRTLLSNKHDFTQPVMWSLCPEFKEEEVI